MPSIQRRHTARAQILLLAVAFLFTVALALVPATSPAHSGHSHGLSRFDGRIPGQPDYQKIGGVITRFDAKAREYVVKRPGEPAMRAHVESDAPGAAVGVEAIGGYYPLPLEERKPVCATSGHRIIVVRAYDRGTGTADEEDTHIRSLVGRMNWKFMQQAQLSSEGDKTVQMKVDCDARGTVTVTDVEIQTGSRGPGFDTTDGNISVLDASGYVMYTTLGEPRNTDAIKYLIFYDRDLSGGAFVGIGWLWRDPDKSSADTDIPGANSNRIGTTSAVISRNPGYTLDGSDSWESSIPVHELLHVMGAAFTRDTGDPVEWTSAPYANTGFHCVDGIDILCYQSGTSTEGSYTETRCPKSAGYGSAEGVAIDCRFDTYFDAREETGEWLNRWWNIGGVENPFLVEGEASARGIESDVNGDQRSDLVAVDFEGTAHVFRGTDSGIEASTSTTSLSGQVDPALYDGGGHYLIDTADVTGEGRSDLVTMNSSGGVYVHKGTLYNAFAPAIEARPTSLKPVMNGSGDFEPIAVADMNGDGRGDLVGLDGATQNKMINTFLGQPNGTFAAPLTNGWTIDSPLFDGVGRRPLDIADVNGDGYADIVTIEETNGLVTTFKGTAAGTVGGANYQLSVIVDPVFNDGRGVEPVGVGDVTGDGKADLLFLDAGTLKLYQGKDNGSGTPNWVTTPITAYAGSIDSSLLDGRGQDLVALLDYNRDGRADLVSVDDQGDTLNYTAQSNGTFASPVTNAGSISSSRLDRGGQEMASEKPFVRRTECSAGGCRWPPARAGPEDTNGDGRSDLITVDSGGTAHVYRGTDTGIEASTSTASLSGQVDPALYDGGGHYLIDTVDVTGDGRSDLITMGSAGGIYVYPGKADRTFLPAGTPQLASLKPVMNGSGDFQPIAVADVDADGHADLVGLDVTTLKAYRGQSNGTFGSAVTNPYVFNPALLDGVGQYFLDVIDVTGDGRADMVGMNNSTVLVYQGQADGSFSNYTSIPIDPIFDNGTGEEPVGMGDVNLDGKADLLTLSGSTLKLRSGQANGTFATATNPYAGSIDSSLLDGRGQDLVALLDYNRDGRADLVALDDQGDTLNYTAQSNGTFASPVTNAGSISSTRLGSTGQEMASEKPFIRRAGCLSTGCRWPPGR
jgi:hypothetical protein